jgi:arylformamidase
MMFTVTIGSARYDADLAAGYVISIPLDFHGTQANAFDAPTATATPLTAGDFIGDTRQDGACNVETLTLTPHCNGTHTECIGHLTQARISIEHTLPGTLYPATVISTPVLPGLTVAERYSRELLGTDALITREALRQALAGCNPAFLRALIIRTLPNNPEKIHQRYSSATAPFFTLDAMEEIVDRGVQHLLVDIPSLDRLEDGGLLAAHRIFWELTYDSDQAARTAALKRTVTEMIYIPDHVQDGIYLLDLQIAPFVTDAAPSRPILFPLSPRP